MGEGVKTWECHICLQQYSTPLGAEECIQRHKFTLIRELASSEPLWLEGLLARIRGYADLDVCWVPHGPEVVRVAGGGMTLRIAWIVWALLIGDIPEGHFLARSNECEEGCVNPKHLTPKLKPEHLVKKEKPPKCPTPGKRAYLTNEVAASAGSSRGVIRRARYLRVYLCPCGAWHLTKRLPKT